MTIETIAAPATTQAPPVPIRFGNKRDVAAMLGMSVRTVDNFMADGMPHLKLGTRRVRFDLIECAEWLKEHYRVQHRRN